MSVKTGAVGSNPKIDKLMNVNSASLRKFAGTAMLSKILQTNAPEGGTGNSGETDASAAAESRKTIQENRAKMSEPELPKEGIYVKDLDEGNVVARYKKAADERALQMEAACTLAFTEEEAMKRSGITEETREEFFAGYLSQESEYLVEGAMLTCTQATQEMIILPHVFTGNSSKTENALEQVENPANDGEKKYATVSDSIRGENIGIFKNCSLAGSSSESKANVLGNVKDCETYGTCYALMDLCEEWVNVADGAVYGKAEGDLKNCINMLSHLGCYQGGMIFPLNTGQGESEEDIIGEIVNIKEEILRLLEEEGLQSVDAYIQRLRTDNPDVNKFLELLGMRENSGSYSNHPEYTHSYYGLYQIGVKTFNQIGFMDDVGKWTDLAKSFGVNSFDSYLKNPTAQDVAIIFSLRWDYQFILSNGDQIYYDTQIEGVDITQSGIIAAYHLVGNGATNDAFNGKKPWKDTYDGNEVEALTYMEEMGGLNVSILFGGIE